MCYTYITYVSKKTLLIQIDILNYYYYSKILPYSPYYRIYNFAQNDIKNIILKLLSSNICVSIMILQIQLKSVISKSYIMKVVGKV